MADSQTVRKSSLEIYSNLTHIYEVSKCPLWVFKKLIRRKIWPTLKRFENQV